MEGQAPLLPPLLSLPCRGESRLSSVASGRPSGNFKSYSNKAVKHLQLTKYDTLPYQGEILTDYTLINFSKKPEDKLINYINCSRMGTTINLKIHENRQLFTTQKFLVMQHCLLKF